MQSKETIQCGIVHRETSPESLHDHIPFRKSSEKISDHSSTPKTYLTSRQNIAKKSRGYQKK